MFSFFMPALPSLGSMREDSCQLFYRDDSMVLMRSSRRPSDLFSPTSYSLKENDDDATGIEQYYSGSTGDHCFPNHSPQLRELQRWLATAGVVHPWEPAQSSSDVVVGGSRSTVEPDRPSIDHRSSRYKESTSDIS